MNNQNIMLRELVAVDSLFADFLSLSDFDYTYTCAEIEVALEVDISYFY